MKKVLITGGSRGIGKAIAQHFLEREYRVTSVSRTKPQFDEQPSNLIHKQVDLRDTTSIENLFKEVKEEGGIDILINNAGINYDGPLLNFKNDTISDLINTNLISTLVCCKLASKLFLKQKSGCIINISSVVALRGNRGQSVYAASKAALLGLNHSLAKELGPKNIRVNTICPGYIETDMTKNFNQTYLKECLNKIPLNRFGTSKEVAEAAFYLANANYVTGSVLTIDGGMSC